MTHKFKFIVDPGHAWLRVPHEVITEVGMLAHAFSGYSYIDGTYMYLEEDCDAGLFVHVYKAKFGVEPNMVIEHVARTDIRNLLRNPRAA